VLAAETLPYPGEEYLCVALTTSDLPANVAIDDDWVAGRDPDRTSYCSPWVVATIKHDAIVQPQGAVTDAFVTAMREACRAYVDPD
jgi:hypothetical protein